MEVADGTAKAQQNRRMTSDWFRSPPTDYLNVSSVAYPRGLRATVAELDESNPSVEVFYWQNQARQFCRNGRPKDDWTIQLYIDAEDFQDATSQSTKFATLGVQSKPLLDALRPALASVYCPLPEHVSDQFRFYPPFNELFFAQARILETLKHAGLGNVKEKQLRLFVTVMKLVLKKLNNSVREMASNRIIDFEHIWTLFAPGSFAVTDVLEVPHIRQVIDNPAQAIMPDPDSLKPLSKHIPIKFASCSFDGYNFGTAEDKWLCLDWKGHIGVSHLFYRPLGFEERYEDTSIVKKAIEKGRKSLQYQDSHYCRYNAKAEPIDTKIFSGKVQLNGRIMVDCLQARRSCAGMPGYFALFEHPIGPVSGKTKEVYQAMRQQYLTNPCRRPNKEERDKRVQFYSSYDEFLMLMKPMLPAWSLEHSDWFWVDVSKIEPVTFDANPMDQLIDSSTKQLGLLNIMIKRKLDASTTKLNEELTGARNDSGPLIAMFYGSPGTGKTATARAIAELQQRPLLRVNIPDVGCELANTRTEFLQTLENAMAWKAIVLFDNASVMFGQSEDKVFYDQPHLAVTYAGMLEQYQGVAFLIACEGQRLIPELEHLCQVNIRFPSFSRKKREKIWKQYVNNVNINVSSETLRELSKWELNGHVMHHIYQNLKLLYPSGESKEVPVSDLEDVKSLTWITLETAGASGARPVYTESSTQTM